MIDLTWMLWSRAQADYAKAIAESIVTTLIKRVCVSGRFSAPSQSDTQKT